MIEELENRYEAFKRGFNSSESEQDYIKDCWIALKWLIEQGTIHSADLDDEYPPLPWDITERQGFMIRQTLLDLAFELASRNNENYEK